MADELVGNQRRIFRTFLDEDGNEVDPTTVQLEVERPSGTIDTYDLADLSNPSVGYYELDYLIGQAGTFNYRWETTDPTIVAEGSFTAAASALGQEQLVTGPCEAWVSGDDVADYCGSSFTGGSDTSVLDPYAAVASDVFYELSGRVYSGECGPKIVRPCADGCSCWGRVLTRIGTSPVSTVVEWNVGSARWHCDGRPCGCSPVSEVQLAGYPRSIVEVKIDGDVVDPADYRLDPRGKLVRLRDSADPDAPVRWPGCQIIDLPDTEPGTFSVEYLHGIDPPQAGRDAAAALACQLYMARTNNGRCQLPQSVRTVMKGGVTSQIGGLIASSLREGATGVLAIDAFIAAHGQDGNEPSVWSPDLPAYPRLVG